MKNFVVSLAILHANTEEEILYTKTFNNNLNGFKSFLKFVIAMQNKYKPGPETRIWFVMESTGVYYEELAHFLKDHQFNLSVILPNKMKYFGKTLSTKSKNDKIDSRTIATYGLQKPLQNWDPGSSDMKRLRDLTRELNNLSTELTRCKNRLHAKNHSYKPDKSIIKKLKAHICFINKQISDLKKEIIELIKENEKLYRKVNNISKVKGLGAQTIIAIVSEMNEFKLVKNNRQLVSYGGLDVIENQSGTIKGKTRISKQGNSRIRSALYMPALCSIRYEPKLKLHYQRLCKRYNWKDKKKAVMAIMRKLLILIYTLWKNDTEYDPNYFCKQAI